MAVCVGKWRKLNQICCVITWSTRCMVKPQVKSKHIFLNTPWYVLARWHKIIFIIEVFDTKYWNLLFTCSLHISIFMFSHSPSISVNIWQLNNKSYIMLLWQEEPRCSYLQLQTMNQDLKVFKGEKHST